MGMRMGTGMGMRMGMEMGTRTVAAPRSTAASWRRCRSSRGCRISAAPSRCSRREQPPRGGRTRSRWPSSRWVRDPLLQGPRCRVRGTPRCYGRWLPGALPHVPPARGPRGAAAAAPLPGPAPQPAPALPREGLRGAGLRPPPPRQERAGTGTPGRWDGPPGSPPVTLSIPSCCSVTPMSVCRWEPRRWGSGTSTCPTPWSPRLGGMDGVGDAVALPPMGAIGLGALGMRGGAQGGWWAPSPCLCVSLSLWHQVPMLLHHHATRSPFPMPEGA